MWHRWDIRRAESEAGIDEESKVEIVTKTGTVAHVESSVRQS